MAGALGQHGPTCGLGARACSPQTWECSLCAPPVPESPDTFPGSALAPCSGRPNLAVLIAKHLLSLSGCWEQRDRLSPSCHLPLRGLRHHGGATPGGSFPGNRSGGGFRHACPKCRGKGYLSQGTCPGGWVWQRREPLVLVPSRTAPCPLLLCVLGARHRACSGNTVIFKSLFIYLF